MGNRSPPSTNVCLWSYPLRSDNSRIVLHFPNVLLEGLLAVGHVGGEESGNELISNLSSHVEFLLLALST